MCSASGHVIAFEQHLKYLSIQWRCVKYFARHFLLRTSSLLMRLRHEQVKSGGKWHGCWHGMRLNKVFIYMAHCARQRSYRAAACVSVFVDYSMRVLWKSWCKQFNSRPNELNSQHTLAPINLLVHRHLFVCFSFSLLVHRVTQSHANMLSPSGH